MSFFQKAKDVVGEAADQYQKMNLNNQVKVPGETGPVMLEQPDRTTF
jgi:hypothetical protein